MKEKILPLIWRELFILICASQLSYKNIIIYEVHASSTNIGPEAKMLMKNIIVCITAISKNIQVPSLRIPYMD